MAISDLIQEIENALGPSTELDAQIALACGWRREVRQDDDGARTVVWRYGRKEGPLPSFTFSTDAAMQLLRTVDPDQKQAGGVSWVSEEKRATCRVAGVDYIHANSIPLALCVAALKIQERLAGDEL